jgi:hypothetical protein
MEALCVPILKVQLVQERDPRFMLDKSVSEKRF